VPPRADPVRDRRADKEPTWTAGDLVVCSSAALLDQHGWSFRQAHRRELLDRTLISNQRHLLHALRGFETFYNQHRPHQGIANARPLKSLPPPINEPDEIADLNDRGTQHLGGIPNEDEHAA
jgi:hypothetical protein